MTVSVVWWDGSTFLKICVINASYICFAIELSSVSLLTADNWMTLLVSTAISGSEVLTMVAWTVTVDVGMVSAWLSHTFRVEFVPYCARVGAATAAAVRKQT